MLPIHLHSMTCLKKSYVYPSLSLLLSLLTSVHSYLLQCLCGIDGVAGLRYEDNNTALAMGLTRDGPGAPACQDVDECTADIASGDPQLCSYKFLPPGTFKEINVVQCVNTEGSFYCECIEGFNDKNKSTNNNTGGKELTCNEDTDECLEAETCANYTNVKCFNTFGSYICPCIDEVEVRAFDLEGIWFSGNYTSASGWELIPGETKWAGSCRDVNECEGTNNCDLQASCVNTNGSFTCSCNTGWATPAEKTQKEYTDCTDPSITNSTKAGALGALDEAIMTVTNPLTQMTVGEIFAHLRTRPCKCHQRHPQHESVSFTCLECHIA
jgi:hypothetical protein